MNNHGDDILLDPTIMVRASVALLEMMRNGCVALVGWLASRLDLWGGGGQAVITGVFVAPVD